MPDEHWTAPTQHTRGRPTKFNEAIADTIVVYIRAGNYVETAAALAGIGKRTFYDWFKKGATAGPRSLFRQFHDNVRQALAEAEARDVAIITNASATFWQAAAWRLERKFPDRWGRRERIDLTVDLRDEARRIAEERGLPYEEVLAEAEAVLREHGLDL